MQTRGLTISFQQAALFPSGGDEIAPATYTSIEKIASATLPRRVGSCRPKKRRFVQINTQREQLHGSPPYALITQPHCRWAADHTTKLPLELHPGSRLVCSAVPKSFLGCTVRASFHAGEVGRCHVPEANDFGTLIWRADLSPEMDLRLIMALPRLRRC